MVELGVAGAVERVLGAGSEEHAVTVRGLGGGLLAVEILDGDGGEAAGLGVRAAHARLRRTEPPSASAAGADAEGQRGQQAHERLAHHLLGLDAVPWEWDRMATGHASISVLTSMEIGDGHTFMLSSLSNVEHLAKSDRTR